MANTRFSTALHILVSLSADTSTRVSSTSLAKQLGTNPVVVRRLVGHLEKAGLIETRRGYGGGISLKADPASTTLGQIADVIEADMTFELHSISDSTDSNQLPSAIMTAIEAQRRELHTASITQLDRFTLEDVTHAATLRRDLAELVNQGMSDEDIRSNYRIDAGRLIPKNPI